MGDQEGRPGHRTSCRTRLPGLSRAQGISANPVTGVLECHTVGPLEARKENAHDVQAYHVHAFEGIAETIVRPPTLGLRQRFLPGYCMIDLSHTAVVNMVLKEKEGADLHLEDIRIQ